MSDAGPDLEFDYVIVGAGSAGCVLAHRLSADAGGSVCLLEAGPEARHPLVSTPLGMLGLINHPTLNWRYMSAPQAALDGRRIAVPRGRGLGGTSAINGMVYTRGQGADFDHWKAMGNPGWGHDDVLPQFLASETNQDIRDSHHGRAGPMHVATVARPNPLVGRFLKASQQRGYPSNPDPNGQRQEGFGLRQVTIRNGKRVSSATAFLRPVRERANLHILTGAEVDRLDLSDGRARTVRLTDGRRIAARAEIVLAAGVFGSPAILMRSGLGPAKALAGLGIDVHRDLPEVGRNLHDHPSVQVIWRGATTESYGLSLRALPRLAISVLGYPFTGRGLPATNVFEAAGYVRSSHDLAEPDVQLVFAPAFRKPGGTLGLGHGYGVGIVGLQPKSRGSVTLGGPRADTPPLIDFNLLGDDADVALMRRGLGLARGLLAAPAFAGKGRDELAPGAAIKSDDELDAYIRATAATAFHPVGTCAMGTGRVVSHDLKVHGVEGLRVADASIMPRITSGNTHAPTVMIAEKCAAMIRGRT